MIGVVVNGCHSLPPENAQVNIVGSFLYSTTPRDGRVSVTTPPSLPYKRALLERFSTLTLSPLISGPWGDEMFIVILKLSRYSLQYDMQIRSG